MQYVVGKSGVLSLGRQGEHLARRLLFTEPADWERELGPGSVRPWSSRRAGARPTR